jgi:hypothetical protein
LWDTASGRRRCGTLSPLLRPDRRTAARHRPDRRPLSRGPRPLGPPDRGRPRVRCDVGTQHPPCRHPGSPVRDSPTVLAPKEPSEDARIGHGRVDVRRHRKGNLSCVPDWRARLGMTAQRSPEPRRTEKKDYCCGICGHQETQQNRCPGIRVRSRR